MGMRAMCCTLNLVKLMTINDYLIKLVRPCVLCIIAIVVSTLLAHARTTYIDAYLTGIWNTIDMDKLVGIGVSDLRSYLRAYYDMILWK
jgi:hypothetical protein